MKDTYFTTKRFYIYFTLLFVFFGVVIAFSASGINYYMAQKKTSEKIKSAALNEFSYKREMLDEYIQHMERVVKSVSNNPITKDFITHPSEENREYTSAFFYPVIYANREVFQFRFLDNKGHEQIRLNKDYTTGDIFTTPIEDLQYKGNRYYFMATNRLYEGGLWHSQIDLNEENGKLVLPFEPAYRIASPIYINSVFEGIVIVNIHISEILDDVIQSQDFIIYLYDSKGEIIMSPNPDLNWSKYTGSGRKIYDLFPDFLDKNVRSKETVTTEYAVFPLENTFKNNNNISIMMIPKTSMLEGIRKNNYITAFIIAMIVLVITLPLSWLVSLVPGSLQSRLIKAFDKIKRFNYIIDSNVVTTASNIDGIITDVSTKLLELTGYEKKDLIGQKQSILRHPDTPQEVANDLWKTISSGKVWEGEIRMQTKNGETLWLNQTATPEIDADKKVKGYTFVASDITDKKRVEELSMRDRLTGLYNRHKLDIVLKAEEDRFNRYNRPFSVMLIDADHFKNVNDTYGHQVGDDVLIKLSKLMESNIRSTDHAGRWGGEEFIIIASETDADHSLIMAEKIRSAIEASDFSPVEKVTVSIGVAEFHAGETVAKFINRADMALYQAKQTGRNKVCLSEIK